MTDTTPCSSAAPHIAHRAWTTDPVGVCPGVPAADDSPHNVAYCDAQRLRDRLQQAGGNSMSADWAGTTEDMFDLHRFTADKTALCDPAIRTYSSRRPDDRFREPYMTLRSRAQIEATGFADRYRFCAACSTADTIRNQT